MATTIKLKNGSGAPLAGDLVQGEPALDLTNKRLYTEDSGGTVIEVGTNPSTLTVDTDTLAVDATNNRVGIGTASPGRTLDVEGIIRSNGTSGAFALGGNSSTPTEGAAIHRPANGTIAFVNESSESMRIDDSGNVGIGTTSPSSKLHVKGSNSGASAVADGTLIVEQGSTPSIQILSANTQTQSIKFGDPQDGDVGKINYSHSDDSFRFITNATERMRIDSSGRVGIGVSSPAEMLDINEGSTATYIRLRNATSTTGYIGYGTGASATDMTFWTDGTKQVTLDGSGNVGIGTSDPSSFSIDTGPDIILGDGTDNPHLSIVSPTTGTGYVAFADGTTGNEKYRGLIEYAHTTDHMGLRTGGTERMRIDSSGNVGIGTTSPETQLEVNAGSGNSSVTIRCTNNTSQSKLRFGNSSDGDIGQIAYDHTSEYMSFTTNTSEAMRIDSSGNVNIGTARSNVSPELNVTPFLNYANTAAPSIGIGSNNDTSVNNGKTYQHRLSVEGDQGGRVLAFKRKIRGSSDAESMRIDSSGNLLVGTTSASNTTGTGVKLFPEGYGGASTAVGIVGASSTSANSGFRMYSTGASAYRFYVDYAGTIFATSTSISAISDASLKENVRDLDKGLDTINALQPRRFDWKNGDGNDIMGFIAQEVEEVMPELVHEYKYSDEENKKGLKMGDMVPSMVKAIQELSAQVNELKAEVAALKGA